MRDLIARRDLGLVSDGEVSLVVPCHGVRVLRLQPMRWALLLADSCCLHGSAPVAGVANATQTNLLSDNAAGSGNAQLVQVTSQPLAHSQNCVSRLLPAAARKCRVTPEQPCQAVPMRLSCML